MQINALTSRQLKVFHNRLARDLGVKFYSTGLLARIFRALYNRFIEQYLPIPDELFSLRPFTIKDRIFLRKPPGSNRITPLTQILIAVHECTHAMRIGDYPGTVANWYGSYFTNEQFRAMEEASCQEAEAELRFWLYGQWPELVLDNYLCSEGAVYLANISYRKKARMVARMGRGTTTHTAAKKAMSILIQLGVERQK